MLTIKENLLETMKGGSPDRYVNQYEFVSLLFGNPYSANNPSPVQGGPRVVNKWGVTLEFPENTPGAFPVHDEDHIVCRDVTKWRECVKAPNVKFSEEEWEPFIKEAGKIDRDKYYVAPFIAPGIFEQCHYLMGMQNCLISLYDEPEAMHELIDYITDWEIEYAEQICQYLKPNAVFHHDDWGSRNSSFFSPEMFEEFFVPAYKKLYGYYREHGVELIIHHSDSYGENLVPQMIDIGIDIWQGVMSTNDISGMIARYGDRITFMGGIDDGLVDVHDWTKEGVDQVVNAVCGKYGKKHFIPCITVGGPASIYPGVYEELTAGIDRYNNK